MYLSPHYLPHTDACHLLDLCSYYGISASVTIAVINYVLLGWELPVDGYYIHSFEIWLAVTIVFFGAGTVGFTFLEYRLGDRGLVSSLITNIKWIPFLYVFVTVYLLFITTDKTRFLLASSSLAVLVSI